MNIYENKIHENMKMCQKRMLKNQVALLADE